MQDYLVRHNLVAMGTIEDGIAQDNGIAWDQLM